MESHLRRRIKDFSKMKEIVAYLILCVDGIAYSEDEFTQGLNYNFIKLFEKCVIKLHMPSFRIVHDIYPRHKFEQFNEYGSTTFSNSLQNITFNIKNVIFTAFA